MRRAWIRAFATEIVGSTPEAESVAEAEAESNRLRVADERRQAQSRHDGNVSFVDQLVARAELKAGKLEITKFDARSEDGELHVDFLMTLNQDIQSSLVTGCLRFNGSPALLKRDAKTATAISATGAPLGPDKLFHIKLDGPLREVRRIGAVCGAAAVIGWLFTS